MPNRTEVSSPELESAVAATAAALFLAGEGAQKRQANHGGSAFA